VGSSFRDRGQDDSRHRALIVDYNHPVGISQEKDTVRVAAGLLTVLYTGVLSQALATEPQPPSPPPAQAAPAPAEPQSAAASKGEQSAATPSAQQNAAPTPESAPAKIVVTADKDKPELTALDKEMISRGYKLEMRHGEKYFCRRESQMDSRFQIKSCNTAESIEAQRLSSQEALRTIQSDRPQIGK
jgi:hypothetical protein